MYFNIHNIIYSRLYNYSLGEGCSHSAAILFKIEAAVRNGYTSVTSNMCRWNQVFSSKVCKSFLVTSQDQLHVYLSQFYDLA